MSAAVGRPWWSPPSLTTVEMGEAPIPWDDYFPASYWRRPIVDRTPYQHPTHAAANSANWVRTLCEQMDLDPATGLKIPGANNGKAWMGQSNPLYIVPVGQPRRPFHGGSPGMLTTVGGGDLNRLLQDGVPLPVDAITDAAGDRWMNAYQPGTDSLWEMFSVSRSDPTGALFDKVGWGGVVLNRVSRHPGTYQHREDIFGAVIEHERWSGNACSMVNVPWVDMDLYARCVAEQVPYPSAIPISLGRAQGSPIQYVYPATRGDGVEYNRPDWITEGARIVLPLDADLSRVRPEFMPIALAGQVYGFIPRDKTGLGVNLQLRNYKTVGSAKNWKDVLTLYQASANAANEYMTSLPWHQAVIVSPDQSR